MDKYFAEICEYLAKTDDAKNISKFLESLLTPKR